jgi:hypothetical protein
MAKAVAGVGAAGTVVLTGAVPAFAHDTTEFRTFGDAGVGGHADCWVRGWASHTAVTVTCNLWDDNNDGDSIYLDWAANHYGSSTRRAECTPADTDCTFTDERTVAPFPDTQINHVTLQLCRNSWPAGDPCTGEVDIHFK